MRILSLVLVGSLLSVAPATAHASPAELRPLPGLLRMPTVRPRGPEPVPMPRVAPTEPGPVPMPEVGLSSRGGSPTLVVPAPR